MDTDQERHIRTILAGENPHSVLAEDIRAYARGFPTGLSTTFRRYADNLEACHILYTYPLAIHSRWMAESARMIRPELTAEEAARDLAPRFFDFVESRSKGLKDAAQIHARMMYVSLWSLHDAFIQDFVCGLCNELPQVFRGERTEKLLVSLTSHHLAISSMTQGQPLVLGDLLFAGQAPPSYSQLKKLLLITEWFGASVHVTNAFADDRLRILEKRRHLVAHNAGAVDHKYVSETSCTAPIGTMIEVSPADVMQGLSAIHGVSFQLAAELAGYLKKTQLDEEVAQLKATRRSETDAAATTVLDTKIASLEQRIQKLMDERRGANS